MRVGKRSFVAVVPSAEAAFSRRLLVHRAPGVAATWPLWPLALEATTTDSG